MNLSYLLWHISCNLHTPVQGFSYENLTQKHFVPDFSICARTDFEDTCATPLLLCEFLHNTFPAFPSLPVFFSLGKEVVYAFVPTPERAYFLGPVCFLTPVSLKYTFPLPSIDKTWLKAVAACTFSDFVSLILLLYNLFQESVLDEHELISFNCMDSMLYESAQSELSNLVFQNRESNRTHNPYDQELREFSSIENGDVEMLRKSLSEDYVGQVGTLAKNKLRHWRNLSIVVITLACRAAIRGGLQPEIAFSMSDIQIQKIEEQTSPVTLLNLTHEFEFLYAQAVADIKAQKRGRYKKDQNLRVNQCKDYIFTHLHEKILVKDIAKELQIHENYLSKIFCEYEGMTISDFILQEKIKLVKNLLIYSSYSYIEIAAYLGFSSQSYLGKQFKKVTDMTLRQYREVYGVKEFIRI